MTDSGALPIYGRATMWPDEFPDAEIHIRHNGAVWVVLSHFRVQRHFSTLDEAKEYANRIRNRLTEKPRLILHRASSPACGEGG